MTEQVTTPAKDDEVTGDFICPNCRRWFPTRSKRLRHVITTHPEVTLK